MNVTWGLFSKSNGDCSTCRQKCDEDFRCRGVECGGEGIESHCSWWRGKSCRHNEERKTFNEKFQTCLKIETGNQDDFSCIYYYHYYYIRQYT